MSSEFIDHLDPLFLVSRELDRDLTEAEACGLKAALAASAELRAEAERLAAVHRAVDRWSADRVTFDDTALTHAVMTRVRAEAAEPGLAKVDAALRRWSAQPVEFDQRAFAAGVARRIRVEKAGAPLRLVYRMAAPLALAAAVGLAITGGLWFAASRAPRIEVAIGPRVLDSGGSKGASLSEVKAELIVSFERSQPEERMVWADAPTISMGAVGAMELDESVETPPL